jgi:hypothetical protein
LRGRSARHALPATRGVTRVTDGAIAIGIFKRQAKKEQDIPLRPVG